MRLVLSAQPGGSVDVAANTATITGVTSFSDWTLSEAAVLPVSLLTFSGYKESNHNVLKWTTANESNNSGFEIQRSADGINFDVMFCELAGSRWQQQP